jgi:4-hydroxy-tetrahydrodipicolinate synthase
MQATTTKRSESKMKTKALAPGVWGVVATPFVGVDLDVDHKSLGRLVKHYEAIGAAGLTVLGVFGEAAALDRQERRDVLSTVASAVSLPLVVGVSSLSTKPAIEEVRDIQNVIGARLAGAMIQLNSSDPTTLSRHLATIARSTGAGIVAQNYPVSSGVSIELTAELEALAAVEGIVAIKAEAAPTARRIAALTERFEIPVFGGLGGIGLIDELSLGASGAMTGFSYPEGLIETVNSYAADGFAGARDALIPYLALINFEQQPGIALAIRKACLVARGMIAEAGVRAPARGLPEALREQLHRHIDAVEAFRASR